MVKSALRKLLVLLVSLGVLCASVGTAFAAEPLNFDRAGSITVTVRNGEIPVSGCELTLYQVALAVEEDGNCFFEAVEPFEAFDDLSQERIQSAQLPAELAAVVREKPERSGLVKTVDQDGKVVFENLELGLYLVMQTGQEEDYGYMGVDPFLVTVPVWEDDQGWLYEVDAYPKGGEVTPEESTPPTTPSVPDTPAKPHLPQTGQLWWPVPVLAAAGLLSCVVGLIRRRGANDEEK